VLTPDDLMAGRRPAGHVVVYDDDHFYMGGVLVEALVDSGASVTLVTPAAEVSVFTHNTMEQHRIHRRLVELGVVLMPHHVVAGCRDGHVEIESLVTGRLADLPADALVLVTSRLPNDRLAEELEDRREEWGRAGLRSVRAIGDAFVPSAIVGAVWDGRRFAEELDGRADAAVFRRNVPLL